MLGSPVISLLAGVGLVLVVAASPGAAQDVAAPRVMSARDTLRVNQVGNPRLSPDGEWVLYTQGMIDLEEPELLSVTNVWRVRVDGTANRQLTRGRKDALAPAWSPSGETIAFVSARGNEPETRTQVYFMHRDGGEAWQVTTHDESVNAFSFSPDGTKLLFTARDRVSDEEENFRQKRGDAEIVNRSFRMVHLWVHDLETSTTARVTDGDFVVANPDWSPDSQQVVFEMRPTPTANDRWRSDIWIVDVETGDRRLLYENSGSDTYPRWSPDGSTVAFASNEFGSSNTMHDKLQLLSLVETLPRQFLEEVDRNFSRPIWSTDGSYIFWAAGKGTSTSLFRVALSTGAVTETSTLGGRNDSWELSQDGDRWVWVHTSGEWPAEIYTATIGGSPVSLTDANAWLRDEAVGFGSVETVRWKNSNGMTIEGVVTKPVDFREGVPYPFILNPHGGPTSASLEAFDATNQFFAGNGYVVLQPNFRGSTNYGQTFVNANIDAWGIADYDDVMTGVDYILDMGWVDEDRLICFGWSYGGYLAAWIATQTDRFKAVSPGAGLTNLYSMYSTNDLQDYLASFFGGTPWTKTENYRRHSPMTYVADVMSPVLLMHGGSDTRVPPEQSMEFFQALKDLDKEVTFVRFPREGHGIREPLHRMDRLKRYAEFFGKHVDNPPVSERQVDLADAVSEEGKQ